MSMTALLPTTVHDVDHPVPGVRFVRYDPTSPIPDAHRDADVLVAWGMPDAMLADAARRLRRLRLVQLLSAGSDAALRAGFAPEVTIASGRGLHDAPVAEHALALILAAARRLHLALRAQQDRVWAAELGGLQQEPSPGLFSTLRGAQVTIWGYGSIGSSLAPHLTALGATVTGVGRSARLEGTVPVIHEGAIDAQLARTDVLVMILPSTPATRHVMDADKLAALPGHAWLVNVGRGDTVDEAALIDALAGRRIGGAALDVTGIEPLLAASPLWTTPNTIITPHAAGGRPLGWFRLVERNITALIDGRAVHNVVDR